MNVLEIFLLCHLYNHDKPRKVHLLLSTITDITHADEGKTTPVTIRKGQQRL
jgi:hypothetical protein